MNDFLNGFADELITKEAAHPLFRSVQKGGTLLGQRVRGMLQRIKTRSKVIRKATRPKAVKAVKGAKKLKRKSIAAARAFKKTSMSQETLPGVVRQPKQPKASYGTGGGGFVRERLRESGSRCGPKYGCGGGKHGVGCGLR